MFWMYGRMCRPSDFRYPDWFVRIAVFCGDLMDGLPPEVERRYTAIRLRGIPAAVIKVKVHVIHIWTITTCKQVVEESVNMVYIP